MPELPEAVEHNGLKIAPCPFCGEKKVRLNTDDEQTTAVLCESCEATGPPTADDDAGGWDRRDAIKAWNRRAGGFSHAELKEPFEYLYKAFYPYSHHTVESEDYELVDAIGEFFDVFCRPETGFFPEFEEWWKAVTTQETIGP